MDFFVLLSVLIVWANSKTELVLSESPLDCERENQIRPHYQVASEPVIGPHRFHDFVQQPVQQRRRLSVIHHGRQ